MPSERVQHAYGLIQKTLQQSGIIHNHHAQHTDSASNPYGYSHVSQQQTSWQQAGPPPPPPVPAYGPNAHGSMPGKPPTGPAPPAPPLVTPTQATYASPPIPPPYRPLDSQNQQSWTSTAHSDVTASAPQSSYTPTQSATPQQQQGFSSMFPPPPPPKPHQFNIHPPPLPPRPGTQGQPQGQPPDQASTWLRPQVQTAQSVPNFQHAPPTAHPFYRKYGQMLQEHTGTPLQAFPPPTNVHDHSFPIAQQQAPSWQQPIHLSHQATQPPFPQDPSWQAPISQQPPISPIQYHPQPYSTTQTQVNQPIAPLPHIFKSSATNTAPIVPSVSPPPYNYASPPPPPPGGPPPSGYFGRDEHIAAPQTQIQRPPSIGSHSYDPPVSPPIPTVSPLVSRQGSLASQSSGNRERQDTVSSISTGPMLDRHDAVPSTSPSAVDRPTTPKAEKSGGFYLQRCAGAIDGSTAGTSASALGFGGPGGWEYYTPFEGDSEDEAEKAGNREGIEKRKKDEDEPVSPVELPSEPIAPKKEAEMRTNGDGNPENEGIYELPADFSMDATAMPAHSSIYKGQGLAAPSDNEKTGLPKPSTRYNRIPRPQDLIPDLGPWYASSLERYIAMLKQEACATSEGQRAAAFVEFVAVESQIRGIPYYTKPPGQAQEHVEADTQKPKLPLEIPPSATDDIAAEDIQYSPGGRPILRTKPSARQNKTEEVKTAGIAPENQSSYKPFRQGASTANSETSSQPAIPTPTSLPSEPSESVVQSAPVAATQQPQYKPYTPGTPTASSTRKDSLPHRSSVSTPTTSPPLEKHEHAETFFPAPLALRAKKDGTSTPPALASSTASPPHVEEQKLSAPSGLPYPTTPSQTPPPPELPSAASKLSSKSTPITPSAPTSLARLRALLAKPRPPSSNEQLSANAAAQRIQQTLASLPCLDATRAHITSLQSTFDSDPGPRSASAQAETLFSTLATERGETQMLNDMAFESHEITYPELLARDEALKREEVERVAAHAEKAGRDEAAAYARWEGEVFAGVYGRVREEVDGGVAGLAAVEEVGAEAMRALSGEAEEAGGAGGTGAASGGLVKINARTGEVIVVDGLTPAAGGAASTAPPPAAATGKPTRSSNGPSPPSIETTLSALETLNASSRALLALHAHISAHHALLARAVADRDARYARAEVAPLEFLVAFDDLENPAAASATATTHATSRKLAKGNDEKTDGKDSGGGDGDDDEDDDDTRKKLRDLRRHFTGARLAAGARTAAEEEVRARQTWQRVEAWMGAGVGAVARAIDEVVAAVAEVGEKKGLEGGDGDGRWRSEGRELLDRAEEVVEALAEGAEGLVRAFYDAEVLLNEAEFAVSVEEAKVTVFDKGVATGREDRWEGEAEKVVAKLEREKRKEDAVLKEELDGRLKKIGEEQRGKGLRVVKRARAKVIGREDFGDEDRIVGWVS